MKILDTYNDGKPRLIKWFRNDGVEVQSYIRYEEFNNSKKEKISYSVWGTLFDIDKGIVQQIEQRFYIKEVANSFYEKMKKLYPASRLNYGECVLKKEYY